MKILITIIISFIFLYGCGKKSEPKYQGKTINKIINIS